MACWELGPQILNDSAGQALSVPLVLELPMHGAVGGSSPLPGIKQGSDFFKERNDPIGPPVCIKS